jgi:hypothetical protein
VTPSLLRQNTSFLPQIEAGQNKRVAFPRTADAPGGFLNQIRKLRNLYVEMFHVVRYRQ